MDAARIDYINKETVKFPIFFYTDEDMGKIVQSLYVEEINGATINNMPYELIIVRETESGVRTTASYVLKQSLKSMPENPMDN